MGDARGAQAIQCATTWALDGEANVIALAELSAAVAAANFGGHTMESGVASTAPDVGCVASAARRLSLRGVAAVGARYTGRRRHAYFLGCVCSVQMM